MKKLIILAFIIEIASLTILRMADAKKPSLDVFFDIAESTTEKELKAMTNRDIERLAQVISK